MKKTLVQLKQEGEKIAMLTAYDATFAAVAAQAGVDAILVGDSLGMVIQGRTSTHAVRLADIIYHVRAVAAGSPKSLIIADMPFATFQASPVDAYKNASKCIAAGAGMVKIEGDMTMVDTVEFLVRRNIPVCAHVGLKPQSVLATDSYRVQGRDDSAAQLIIEESLAFQRAGASCLILELLPGELAQRLTNEVAIPTIGIGSGKYCDGQVLVLHDMIGLTPQNKKFIRNFMVGCDSIQTAIASYVRAVKSGEFPAEQHTFK